MRSLMAPPNTSSSSSSLSSSATSAAGPGYDTDQFQLTCHRSASRRLLSTEAKTEESPARVAIGLSWRRTVRVTATFTAASVRGRRRGGRVAMSQCHNYQVSTAVDSDATRHFEHAASLIRTTPTATGARS